MLAYIFFTIVVAANLLSESGTTCSLHGMEVCTLSPHMDLYEDLDSVHERITCEKAQSDLLRVETRASEAEKLSSKLKKDVGEHKLKVRLGFVYQRFRAVCEH